MIDKNVIFQLLLFYNNIKFYFDGVSILLIYGNVNTGINIIIYNINIM